MAKTVRRIPAQKLQPGMVLANAILSDSHALLVTEKTCLTQILINRIVLSGVQHADILIEAEPAAVPSVSRSEERRLVEQQIKMTRAVRDSFERMRLTRALPHEEFVSISNEIAATMLDTPGVLHSLQVVRSVDNYTYTHSVNVGVLAGLIGKWTGYADTPSLVLAGLLHDVGKTQIPLEILNKPSSLTQSEYAVMRKHSALGYEITLENHEISDEVKSGILYHHERMDGTGYPHGLKGEQLPYVPKVLAVADIFDAMTSKRVYRNSLTPFEVLEEIFSEMFVKLDPSICYIFRQRIKDLLVGSTVLLNDGRMARIIFVAGEDHFRPVLQDEQGQSFSPGGTNLQIVRFVTA